jgi:hypothetical protein
MMDVSCLVSSTSLTQVAYLSETSLGDEIRCLARMPKLRVLWLSRCPRVTDVRALIGSTSITTLSLQQTSVTDQGIAGLERMPNLCELVVAHTAVTDVRRFVQRWLPWPRGRRPHEDDRRASRHSRVDYMNTIPLAVAFCEPLVRRDTGCLVATLFRLKS